MYDKWIEKLSKDAWKDGDLFLKNLINSKDSDLFLKKLVDSEMWEQAKIVKDRITNLEIESNNADKELKRIKSLEAEEKAKIVEKFKCKEKALNQEKLKIEQNLEEYSLLESKQLEWAKETLGKLLDFLWNSVKEINTWVVEQSEKLKSQRKTALKHNTRLTAQEIKENILQKGNEGKDKNEKNKKELGKWNIKWKSLWYFIILCITCIFDIFLGYTWIKWFLMDTIQLEWAAIALWLFLAATLIPLVMAFIHALTIGKREWKISKGLWTFMIYFIIFLLILYACQSVSKSQRAALQNLTFWNLVNVLQQNPEFLLRCFIIPWLFAWEVIIDLIDWDLILDYFWIWKRKWPNSLSKLITNWLCFLKSRKISSYAKEEKNAIDSIITEMQKKGIPSFNKIKNDIREVQSVLDPIWNKQTEKQEEFNKKINIVDKKLDENLKERDTEIQEITNKYAPEIKRLKNIKNVNNYKIDKLTYNFNKHSNDTKEWIKIWLFSH